MAKTKKKRVKNPELTEKLQDVLNEIVEHLDADGEALEANFPWGYIRTIGSLRRRWPYLSRNRARTVACAIQLCDVNRFLINSLTVSLTAGAMWEWHVTVPVIAVIETLCYEVVQKEGLAQPDVKFKRCIDLLNSNKVIRQALRDKLHELREYRNNVHLFLNEKVEMAEGKPRRYNDAVVTLHKLEKALNTYYRL